MNDKTHDRIAEIEKRLLCNTPMNKLGEVLDEVIAKEKPEVVQRLIRRLDSTAEIATWCSAYTVYARGGCAKSAARKATAARRATSRALGYGSSAKLRGP